MIGWGSGVYMYSRVSTTKRITKAAAGLRVELRDARDLQNDCVEWDPGSDVAGICW